MRSGVVSGVSVAGAAALVAGLLWWGSADVVADGDPQNAATALVPPDGTRVVSRDSDGVAVSEEARLSGPEMVLTSPPLVGGALATTLDGDPFDWRIWRTTRTTYDVADGDSGEQSTTLRQLTDRGVEQLADYGAFTLVFDPPLLELPADVRAGADWSSSGTATSDGTLTYEAGLEAEEAGDGCLRVTGTVVFASDGDPFFTQDADDTWCEGAGVVAEEDAGAPRFDGSTEPDVHLAVGAEDWSVHDHPVVVAGSVEEAAQTGGEATLGVDRAPAAVGDDRLVVVNTQGQDVIGLVRQGEAMVRAWVGHPGGDVTSLATAGEVTVVGTGRRQVVAYGPRGQWLWSHDLDDVPLSTPVAVDDDHLVVTTTGGAVAVLDPATGEEQWSASLSDQVRVEPVSDGSTLVVADRAGRTRGYGLGSGEVLWTADTEDPVDAMALVGDRVVSRLGGVVQARDLDDGALAWSAPVPTGGGSGLAVGSLGRAVAVADNEQTVGLDPADGHVLWRGDGAPLTLTEDRHLLQIDEQHLRVVDREGEVVGRWTLGGLRGQVDFAALAGAGVWVMDSSGRLVEVGP